MTYHPGDDWQPPRCIHGRIVLGCPRDDCPTQLAYLDQQNAALRDYHEREQAAARKVVRQVLGLPPEPAAPTYRPTGGTDD